jgi:orotate phosphoribosyltransferase
MSSEVARLLLDSKAVSLSPRRPFTWASGIQSPIYCDNRLLLSYPQERQKIVNAFVTLIRKQRLKCDGIAGVATAGIPHGALIADRLNQPLIYVRSSAKGHGKQNQIEGHLKKGSRWIVVEDLISTGGSSLDAIKAIRKAGGKVEACVAIFTYGFSATAKSFQKAKCPLYTLTDFTSLLAVAKKKHAITAADMDLLVHFQSSPHNWRKRG